MADQLLDGAPIVGSYQATINGYAYDFDTADHDLPVESDGPFYTAAGVYKGGHYRKTPETLSVTITAYNGIPAPAQLVRFSADFGYGTQYWAVTNLKIASGNTVTRKYTAEIKRLANAS